MSKLGRYSADRKKIENLDAAKTVLVADCGTIFMVTDSGDAGYTVTLPAPATAGKGWWAKFVVNSATLASNAGDDVLFSTDDDTDAICVHIDINNSLSADVAADTVAFDHTAIKGTHLTWWTDGSTWFVEGAGGNGMILVTT